MDPSLSWSENSKGVVCKNNDSSHDTGSIGGWRPCEIILPAAPAPLCRAPLFELKSGRIDGLSIHMRKSALFTLFLSVCQQYACPMDFFHYGKYLNVYLILKFSLNQRPSPSSPIDGLTIGGGITTIDFCCCANEEEDIPFLYFVYFAWKNSSEFSYSTARGIVHKKGEQIERASLLRNYLIRSCRIHAREPRGAKKGPQSNQGEMRKAEKRMKRCLLCVSGDALLAGRHVPEEPDPAARQLQPLLPPPQTDLPLLQRPTQV
ncbi:hypothetical protein CEXT_353981 [Caerostris extrusa]|uniref:Uncharacterized protein n=1 Tax=Caerostris extrusa TaxID=172846 RepID=A0AAV4NNV1_CAEEX|nr:hypothetical protein CEXT_353981 [Caerostris extrusa]